MKIASLLSFLRRGEIKSVEVLRPQDGDMIVLTLRPGYELTPEFQQRLGSVIRGIQRDTPHDISFLILGPEAEMQVVRKPDA